MEDKFYFDTSIWRDYYENRSDKFRPLGEWALKLINKIIEEGDIIFYSDFVVKELEITFSIVEIEKIFEIIKTSKSLVKVEINKGQVKEASKLAKERSVAFGDALHAILARDNKALLISRDKHFDELTDIVETKKPEELI